MLTIGVSGKKGKEKTFPNYFDKMTKKTKIGLIQLKISKNIELNLKMLFQKLKLHQIKEQKLYVFLNYFCLNIFVKLKNIQTLN